MLFRRRFPKPSSWLGVEKKTKPNTTKARIHQSKEMYYNTHTRLTALLSGTTRVSRYQKGKTNRDFTEARDSEWQWHQMGRMQVCISLQTDNHASTSPLSFLQAGCPSCHPTNSVRALKALQHKINTKKLKPGSVAFYDIRPGNGAGLFSKKKK